MALEIERKFLVRDPTGVDLRQGTLLRQGYVGEGAMTVRLRTSPREAWLTLKGPPSSDGRVRPEFEYSVPLEDANAMLAPAGVPQLAKTRFEVLYGGRLWEVDVYQGSLAGLVTAEVELETADAPLDIPDWVGAEVTGQREWDNEMLAKQGRPSSL